MHGAACELPVWFIGLAACLQAMLTSVTIYGWSNLSVSLIDAGTFEGQCNPTEERPCDAQSSRLNLVFVIGSALTLASSLLLNGWVMDLYGVKVASFVGLACLFVAYGTMAAAADGSAPDDAYFPGFIFLGLGQTGQLHPLYSISYLFPGYESLIIGIINGFADSAVVVFLLFRQLYEAGISLTAIFTGYMLGPLLLATLAAAFVWPWRPLSEADTPVYEADKTQPPSSELVEKEGEPAPQQTPGAKATPSPAQAWGGSSSEEHADDSASCASSTHPPPTLADEETATTVPPPAAGPAFDPQYPYASASFMQQLCSPLYLGLAVYKVISLTKFSWYLSMIGTYLDELGQQDGAYVTILGAVLPIGVVLVLVVGSIIDRAGMEVAMAANFAASLGVSIITLIPNLQVQVVGFVVFAFFRAGLFTILSAILGKEFTFLTFGRLIGVLSVVAGLLGLLNQPLFDYTLQQLGGNFAMANGIYAGASLLQGIFVVYYWRYRKVADGPGHTAAVTWWRGEEGGEPDSPADVSKGAAAEKLPVDDDTSAASTPVQVEEGSAGKEQPEPEPAQEVELVKVSAQASASGAEPKAAGSADDSAVTADVHPAAFEVMEEDASSSSDSEGGEAASSAGQPQASADEAV